MRMPFSPPFHTSCFRHLRHCRHYSPLTPFFGPPFIIFASARLPPMLYAITPAAAFSIFTLLFSHCRRHAPISLSFRDFRVTLFLAGRFSFSIFRFHCRYCHAERRSFSLSFSLSPIFIFAAAPLYCFRLRFFRIAEFRAAVFRFRRHYFTRPRFSSFLHDAAAAGGFAIFADAAIDMLLR